jgi:hypothetical protein
LGIPLVAAKKIQFKDENCRREFEDLAGRSPSEISKPWSHDKGLWLHFEGTLDVLLFRFKGGKVLAIQVICIVVRSGGKTAGV